jgi:hypothetical protein
VLSCEDCPYYCNVTGQPNVPCLRCGRSAREHGKLTDTDEIERRIRVFAYVLGQFELQNTKEKEKEPNVGAKIIADLLNPVSLDSPLSLEPPFEELCVEDVILNLVRWSQMTVKFGDSKKKREKFF